MIGEGGLELAGAVGEAPGLLARGLPRRALARELVEAGPGDVGAQVPDPGGVEERLDPGLEAGGPGLLLVEAPAGVGLVAPGGAEGLALGVEGVEPRLGLVYGDPTGAEATERGGEGGGGLGEPGVGVVGLGALRRRRPGRSAPLGEAAEEVGEAQVAWLRVDVDARGEVVPPGGELFELGLVPGARVGEAPAGVLEDPRLVGGGPARPDPVQGRGDVGGIPARRGVDAAGPPRLRRRGAAVGPGHRQRPEKQPDPQAEKGDEPGARQHREHRPGHHQDAHRAPGATRATWRRRRRPPPPRGGPRRAPGPRPRRRRGRGRAPRGPRQRPRAGPPPRPAPPGPGGRPLPRPAPRRGRGRGRARRPRGRGPAPAPAAPVRPRRGRRRRHALPRPRPGRDRAPAGRARGRQRGRRPPADRRSPPPGRPRRPGRDRGGRRRRRAGPRPGPRPTPGGDRGRRRWPPSPRPRRPRRAARRRPARRRPARAPGPAPGARPRP